MDKYLIRKNYKIFDDNDYPPIKERKPCCNNSYDYYDGFKTCLPENSLLPSSSSNIEKMTNNTPTYNHLIADPNNSIGHWITIGGKWGGKRDYKRMSNEDKDLYINYYFDNDFREEGKKFKHPSRTLPYWYYTTHGITVDIPKEICENHKYTSSGFNTSCNNCDNCQVIDGNFLFKNAELAKANVKTKSGGPVFGDAAKLPPIIGPGWKKIYPNLFPSETGDGFYFTYRATDLKNDEDKCQEAGYTSCANKTAEEQCKSEGYTSCANKTVEEQCKSEGYTSCANKTAEEQCKSEGYTSCANKTAEEQCKSEGYTSCANKTAEEQCKSEGYNSCANKTAEEQCKSEGYTSCANKTAEEQCKSEGYTSCAIKTAEEKCKSEGYTSCDNKTTEEKCKSEGYTSCSDKEAEEACIAEEYTSCADKEAEEACIAEEYTSCADKEAEEACIAEEYTSCADKEAEEVCTSKGFTSCDQMILFDKLNMEKLLEEADQQKDEQEDEHEDDEDNIKRNPIKNKTIDLEKDKLKLKVLIDEYLESLKMEFILNNYFTMKFEKVSQKFLTKKENEKHYLVVVKTDKIEEKLKVKIIENKASLVSPKNASFTSGYAIILYLLFLVILIIILTVNNLNY